MKLYFAKYIPVEEEIKLGDKAIGYDGKIIDCTESNRFSIQEHWKKVKLFLCSRDIKVGDEVLHLPDTHPKLRFKIVEDLGKGVSMIEYIEHPKGRFIGNQREWLTCNLFKIIGEISPDTLTYVKQEDEFNEDEVESSVFKYLHEIGGNIRPFIKIKGPCGHFH